MKKYKKVKVVAKNNPKGSYAAGCPEHHRTGGIEACRRCEFAK
jgi:hypothetical protein